MYGDAHDRHVAFYKGLAEVTKLAEQDPPNPPTPYNPYPTPNQKRIFDYLNSPEVNCAVPTYYGFNRVP